MFLNMTFDMTSFFVPSDKKMRFFVKKKPKKNYITILEVRINEGLEYDKHLSHRCL